MNGRIKFTTNRITNRIEIEMQYNQAAVDLIKKQVPAGLRSYDKRNKIWSVDWLAFDDGLKQRLIWLDQEREMKDKARAAAEGALDPVERDAERFLRAIPAGRRRAVHKAILDAVDEDTAELINRAWLRVAGVAT